MKTWFAFYTSLSTSNLQNYKKKQKYFAVIFSPVFDLCSPLRKLLLARITRGGGCKEK